MSTTTTNLGLFKYNVSTDSNVAFSITKALNNNWDIIDAKCGQGNNLLDFKWSDHLLNDQSWLRADTFSWQNGTTYSQAYNELLAEYNNSASTTKTEGSITFKRTPKGYKIALASQETAIAEKYATDGIAWYYILDTTNKRFKLPRTKFGFEGLRTSVGDDIEAGLPNITGAFALQNDRVVSRSGAFNTVTDSARYTKGIQADGSGQGGVDFNASSSNSIYGKSSTVQPPATQMYLYFYIGAFTKSAEAQTAGLNSELFNGKVDKSDLAEIYPVVKTYINGTSWYRIWSDGYCEQGGRLYNAKDVANTITLLKTMKDTNYSVFIAHGVTGVYNDTAAMKRAEEPFNFTATSFQVYTHPSAGLNTVQWKVCGYLAEGWNNEGIS